MSTSGKIVALEEAAAQVEDGQVVALQTMATFTSPMALVRELIRQERRDLTLVCLVGGIAVDWLAATGSISRFVGAAVSMEQFGMCQQYRKGVESGAIRVEELSETALLARLAAAARGLPFMVTRGLIGTDLVELQPDNLKLIDDPFGGPPVLACRALAPDVALVHVHAADEQGNCRVEPTALWPDLRLFSKAARRVIVTCERIVDTDELRAEPDRTLIPGFVVDAVVPVPRGAHPTSLFPLYGYDGDFHLEWVKASREPEEFLERYVRGPASQDEYLAAVGRERTAV
jgi:glutaconate CoA-transferase, subunit A